MNELREHYRRQDTEELLEIAKKDLLDEARQVLTQVLAERGVSVADAEAAREEGLSQRARASEAQERLASRTRRLFAFAIDVWGVLIVLLVVLLPLRLLISLPLYMDVVTIAWLIYFLLRDSIPGQSLGKRLLGLRAIQVDSERSCTWPKSLLRNLLHLFFVLDALFILGSRRMRLGDMLAGTIVVRSNPLGNAI
jgi:uncharacterized RDD family membrane protein YckC